MNNAAVDMNATFGHSSPYNYIAAMMIPNFIKAWQTAARNQTLVNEGQIVCALERYRLAHGEYPETLDALVPQFIEKLPHDIIGGQPLHYRRMDSFQAPAGKEFLLYSVGWNETDDGGWTRLRQKWRNGLRPGRLGLEKLIPETLTFNAQLEH